MPFISVSAPSIVSGMSGESEKTLRETFEEAKVRYTFCCTGHKSPLTLDLRFLQRVAPSLLFIDEIDAITPKRESAQREMERRIVAQFLTCMDGMALSEGTYTNSHNQYQSCHGKRQMISQWWSSEQQTVQMH